jgi:cytidylate kinase
MTGTIASERCLDYIEAQARMMNRGSRGHVSSVAPRVVTISRQAGSGAHVVADELVKRLEAGASRGAVPWKVFDRDLVEQTLKEHDLPERMAAFMPEHRMSALSDTLDELLGLHPSSSSLVRETADTILHLAELGNVVIIGRGGNIITRHMPGAIHIRLVGSTDRRIEHVQDHHHLDQAAAAKYVGDRDLRRGRYVKKYYARNIDDPLLYDLVVNMDRVPYGEAAGLIAEALSLRSERTPHAAGGGNRPGTWRKTASIA